MWNVRNNEDIPQWKKDLDYCRFVMLYEEHMDEQYVNACRYIQGVPITTGFFQRRTAPTKIIRFKKKIHC